MGVPCRWLTGSSRAPSTAYWRAPPGDHWVGVPDGARVSPDHLPAAADGARVGLDGTIFCIGSCFARNVERALVSRGADVRSHVDWFDHERVDHFAPIGCA